MGMRRRQHPPPPPPPPPPSCPHATAECAAGACVLCVCCPIALLWRSVQVPFRLAWRAARAACAGSGWLRRDRLVEASSSFSDIDFDADLVELTSASAGDESGKRRCFGLVGRRRRRDRLSASSSSSIRRSSRVSFALVVFF